MSTSSHAAVVNALMGRWPENRIGPSLERIRALCDLLGEPQRAFPVIQITGTNGKGSTAIMIESLLRALGLRVGRFSSPHLVDLTERIAIDGVPIDADVFDDLVAEVSPYVEMVDAQQIDGIAMTFFEVMTGLAYAAFSQAPVDVAVIEVGLGGTWDATSVADATVAVITPIDLDHTHILGDTPAAIAAEKSGIIKSGSTAVVARQTPEVMAVIAERAREVGAQLVTEGEGFALLGRERAVGGQLLRIDGAGGPVSDVFLPLHGEHMAANAALAVGAVEAFLGEKPLNPEVIVEGLGAVEAPARLELVHHAPPVVLDTCHNPHGARATIAGVQEAFGFAPLIGVTAAMADKDVDGILAIFADAMTDLVVTTLDTPRAMAVDELAAVAEDHFADERVHRAARMADAIDAAIALADEAGAGAGILIAGSVVAAGEARALLHRPSDEAPAPMDADTRAWTDDGWPRDASDDGEDAW